MNPSPRTMALRYRIWAHCEPLGWDTTVMEIAEALDETPQMIAATIKDKGWHTRLRATESAIKTELWRHRAIPQIPSRVVSDVVSGRIGVLMETFQ